MAHKEQPAALRSNLRLGVSLTSLRTVTVKHEEQQVNRSDPCDQQPEIFIFTHTQSLTDPLRLTSSTRCPRTCMMMSCCYVAV